VCRTCRGGWKHQPGATCGRCTPDSISGWGPHTDSRRWCLGRGAPHPPGPPPRDAGHPTGSPPRCSNCNASPASPHLTLTSTAAQQAQQNSKHSSTASTAAQQAQQHSKHSSTANTAAEQAQQHSKHSKHSSTASTAAQQAQQHSKHSSSKASAAAVDCAGAHFRMPLSTLVEGVGALCAHTCKGGAHVTGTMHMPSCIGAGSRGKGGVEGRREGRKGGKLLSLGLLPNSIMLKVTSAARAQKASEWGHWSW
jgi:hypothetical protein